MKKLSRSFSVRVDQDFFDEITELAEKEDRTINQQMIHLMKRGLADYYSEKKVVGEQMLYQPLKQTEESAG